MADQQNILLTISIPTYNRARYLKICLESLAPQVAATGSEVEIAIYDNDSGDETERTVRSFVEKGYRITYRRNRENIGSDRNIVQCFHEASGKYVLILGDDDVLLDNALQKIVSVLRPADYGGVLLHAFGYEFDFVGEKPPHIGRMVTSYRDANAFIRRVGLQSSFISSIVINKSLIRDIDPETFAGTKLVQSYLFFHAALKAPENLCFDEYVIAAKRDNSGGYRFSEIFARNFTAMMESFVPLGLSRSTVDTVNRKNLWLYFPNHIVRLRSRVFDTAEIDKTYNELHAVYRTEPLFWICVAPSLKLPRFLALLWGYGTVIVGRLANREFARVWAFLAYRASRYFARNGSA